MTTWEEIRDEVAGMLADGKPLEDVITKLEQRKNEMAKANLLKAIDEMKKREQTNEEWLRSTGTTRELAKKLALLVLYNMPLFDRLRKVFEGGESAVIDECENWLKEIHNDL